MQERKDVFDKKPKAEAVKAKINKWNQINPKETTN